MKQPIQRYSGSWDGGCGPNDEGEYVLYADHVAALSVARETAYRSAAEGLLLLTGDAGKKQRLRAFRDAAALCTASADHEARSRQ